MNKLYQPLNIDLEMGTKYLINESAYFLGGIFAANESVQVEDKMYWIAPVRHNNNYLTNEELEEHFQNIKILSNKLSNETLMAQTIRQNRLDSGKFNRLVGFGTFFESKNGTPLEHLIPSVKKALLNSSDEVKRCFIVGMFDGRGAFDRNKQTGAIRYVALDCENSIIGAFLCEILDSCGIAYNYNTARDRLGGGAPRKDQLRIPGSEKYLEKFGFISQKKFEVGISCYDIPNTYMVKNEDGILNGLKRVVKI